MPIAERPPTDVAEALRRSLPRALESLQATCRPEALERGRRYEEEGRVRLLEVGPDRALAEVLGTDDAPYEVSLAVGQGAPTSSCNCTAWGSWDDHCKHVAALAFALDKAVRGDRPSGLFARALAPSPAASLEAPAAAGQAADLEELRDWLGLPTTAQAFSYHLQLGGALALGIERHERPTHSSRGRFLVAAPYLSGRMLDPADRRVFAAVQSLPRDAEGAYHLSGAAAGGVLELLRTRTVFLSGSRLTFAEQSAHLFGELSLTESKRTITVRLRLGDGTLATLESARLLSEAPVFVLHGGGLNRLESGAPLEQLERFRARPTFALPREAGAALDVALGGLRRLGVILDGASEIAPPPAVFVLTLDGDAEAVRALLAVRYGDVELPLTHPGAATHVTTDGRLLRRDIVAEGAAVDASLAAGLSHGGGGAFVARGDRAVDFWTRGVQGLPQGFQIFGPKPHEVVRLRRLTPRASLSQARTGWFSLELAFAEDDQSIDLTRLRPLLASGRRYVKLSDGSVGELPREMLEHVRALLEESGAEPKGGGVELAPYEVGEVERLIELVPEARVEPEARRFLAALRDFHAIEEVELPPGLKAELRPYQKKGLDWLMFLHHFKLSGVLADDMGLGKTVQALALLLKVKKDEGRSPSLVVAPTSVLPNWQRVAARFAPSLKAVVYQGPEREKKRTSFASMDLVLTSYALLRRDFEDLRKTRFRYVILDEAQHVKNPASLGARAARAQQAEHRLVLTGTPLENRLSDLWSLFQFLMPGFLGKETDFRNRYARPIEVDGNSGVRDRLKRRVHPFILRRLKDEVARDLPPRTDTLLPVDLHPGQQALYREMLATARGRVESIIERMGFSRARISVLTELLRLRQVCCDPRLLKLPPGTRLPPSAKLEAFGELVRDLIGEGHRALVFSQFTEMLGYLTGFADEEGLRYEYLDGSTTDRQDRIDRFNAKDGPPLFFISLKAGGTGLNLTGADYVIHYDPWWNPAVEQQAVDRVHRIGQTKPVFSYKLIARGTVEEKMLKMQDRKRTLAASVLASDDAFGKAISEKEIAELFS